MPWDPIVLDLDGDGIELTAVDGSDAYFDFEGDGFAEKTGWVGPDDGLLVRDLNGNGDIDNSSELFGTAEADGFAVLEALDTNGDGIIDGADQDFSSLQIWRDLNGDGRVDAGELASLSASGIGSISLDRTPANQTIAGNEVALSGTFTWSDGTLGKSAAVFFAVDKVSSRWVPPEGFVIDPDALLLPELRGYGLIPDLAYAMTQSPALFDEFSTFILGLPELQASQIRSQFTQLLFKWADIQSDNLPNRGDYIDPQHIAFLEKFFGSPIDVVEPNASYAAILERSFQDLVDVYLTRLLAGSAVSAFMLTGDVDGAMSSPFVSFTGLTYDNDLDTMGINLEVALRSILNNSVASSQDPFKAMSYAVIGLMGLKLDAFGGDQAAFSSAIATATNEWTDQALRRMVEVMLSASVLVGTTGDDVVTGGAGRDILGGGVGADTLTGMAGSDSYVVLPGGGQDTVSDSGGYGSAVDEVILVGRTVGSVSLVRDGADLVIAFLDPEDTVRVNGQFAANPSGIIERFIFADGVLTADEVEQAILAAAATNGDDMIVGFVNSDTLAGGLGDDTLDGGGGEDTYVYNAGDGHDRIIDAPTYSSTIDQLVLGQGLTSDLLQIDRSGSDLVLSFTGQDGSVTLVAEDNVYGGGVEQIVFGDGEVLTRAQLMAAYVAQQIAAGATTITGFNVSDDVLTGTSGNDVLTGLDGADTLTGGLGDDVLNGGGGVDTYVYNAGDGHDRIIDANSYNSTIDQLALGAGLTSELLEIAKVGSDLILSFTGLDGSVTLVGQDNLNGGGIERIVFGDGEVWTRADLFRELYLQSSTPGDDVIVGSTGADTLAGGLGDDTLDGGGGEDAYVYNAGDGHDRIIDAPTYSSTIDQLVLGQGLTSDLLEVAKVGKDLILSFTGLGGSVTLVGQDSLYAGGIEQVVFGDGEIWTRAQLLEALPELPSGLILGSRGVDTLYGTSEEDRFEGDLGNDFLAGGQGSDTYVFAAGDGSDYIDDEDSSTTATDVLELTDVPSVDVTLTRSGVHLLVGIDQTGETLTIDEQFWNAAYHYGVEEIRFSDGIVWDRERISSEAWFRGTDSADDIRGDSSANTFFGGLGDDNIYSGAGSDVFIYRAGDGNDMIDDEDGSTTSIDVLKLHDIASTDIMSSRVGSDLILTITATGHTINIDEQFYSSGWYGVERIEFSDGLQWDREDLAQNAWIRGGVSADVLSGTNADETFFAGLGDDSIYGGAGSDTYIYSKGDGSDFIDDEDGSSAGTDVLVFEGVASNAVSLSRDGYDLRIVIDETGESLVIDEQFYPQGFYGLEEIQFTDGVTWDRDDILTAMATSTATTSTVSAQGLSVSGWSENPVAGVSGAWHEPQPAHVELARSSYSDWM